MNLNQITIPSSNVVKAVEFYKILGLTLIVDSSPRYVRFLCPEGDTTFSIHHQDNLPTGQGITVYFEVENLLEKVKELEIKGIVFETEIIDQPWLWKEIALKDLDDNKIIIFQAGENRKNPPWKI